MKDKNQIEFLITNYFSGKATEEERLALEEWVRLSPENNRYFQEMRNIWQVMNPAFIPAGIEVEKAERKVIEKIGNIKPIRKILIYWQRIAAVVTIPLLLLYAYFFLHKTNNQNQELVYQEVRSPHGTFSEINLPDGTSVWLNGGSTLKFPLEFKKGERNVFLNGEGYFEVHSDQKNPFIVKTNQLTLTATGTAFNIEAYENDSISAVTMVNGQINVAFGKSPQVVMVPGERASFNSQTTRCRITQTDPYKWYAWKDGLMMFRDDPLSYVFKRLEQTFNVDIDLKDFSLANAPYRATFNYESLDEILRLLELSAPIHFKQSKRIKNASNTYEKLRIEVFRKIN